MPDDSRERGKDFSYLDIASSFRAASLLDAFSKQKEGRVTLNRLTAITVAATIVAGASASAAPLSITRPEFASPRELIVQVQYNSVPADVMGGLLGGIVGGALGGGCYFNDCGYDYGPGYYGGGYYGGGYGGAYHAGAYHGGYRGGGVRAGGAYHGGFHGGGHVSGAHGGKTH
jgi:hypothetical protein